MCFLLLVTTCRIAAQRTYCCASTETLSVLTALVTVKCVHKQYKGNICFHGNNSYMNAPWCYIIHTLPNLLLSSITTLYIAHKPTLQLRWSVRQPPNTRTHIWFEATLGAICGGQNHIRKSFPPSTSFYPVRIIPSGPIYYQYYISSATDSVVKHCTLES
jgi:hypothetical protein